MKDCGGVPAGSLGLISQIGDPRGTASVPFSLGRVGLRSAITLGPTPQGGVCGFIRALFQPRSHLPEPPSSSCVGTFTLPRATTSSTAVGTASV